jgi:hypothetical protein
VERRKEKAIRAKATKEKVAGPTAAERARELTKARARKAKAAGTTAVEATIEEEVMTAGAHMAVVIATTRSAITTKAYLLMCRRKRCTAQFVHGQIEITTSSAITTGKHATTEEVTWKDPVATSALRGNEEKDKMPITSPPSTGARRLKAARTEDDTEEQALTRAKSKRKTRSLTLTSSKDTSASSTTWLRSQSTATKTTLKRG